ncbi:hypothetical protein ACFX10_028520 [Malus domestica]
MRLAAEKIKTEGKRRKISCLEVPSFIFLVAKQECTAGYVNLSLISGAKMNVNGHMEMHYLDTGYPYQPTEGFMGFFDGLANVPMNYGHTIPMHDQETAYWSMNMSSYKFLPSGPGSTSYYGTYEVNDHLPRMDVSRRSWEYPTVTNPEEPATSDSQPEEDAVMEAQAVPEECIQNQQNTNTSEVAWQEDIDPDNMTYEELLDLGEAVGTQSRGLSDELISLLPSSKYKCGNFFLRKKSGERCVICQMQYKRGDRQITLPCKHVYHSECISKWLGINKVCPVCNLEVFGEESRH